MGQPPQPWLLQVVLALLLLLLVQLDPLLPRVLRHRPGPAGGLLVSQQQDQPCPCAQEANRRTSWLLLACCAWAYSRGVAAATTSSPSRPMTAWESTWTTDKCSRSARSEA